MSQETDPNLDLEARLSKDDSKINLHTSAPNASLYDKVKKHSKYFVVDGSAYAAFYAPLMAATEYLSGMEWNEIEISRSIGAATGFLSGYGISLLRQWWGKAVGATTKNSSSRKKVVDVAVGMVTTIPSYAPVLYVAGASTKEMMIALLIGPTTAAVAGLTYGPFSDWWRRYWGLESVLYK